MVRCRLAVPPLSRSSRSLKRQLLVGFWDSGVWLVCSVVWLTVRFGFAACIGCGSDSVVKLLSDLVGYCFASLLSCLASRCCSRPPTSCLLLCYSTIFFFCGCFCFCSISVSGRCWRVVVVPTWFVCKTGFSSLLCSKELGTWRLRVDDSFYRTYRLYSLVLSWCARKD